MKRLLLTMTMALPLAGAALVGSINLLSRLVASPAFSGTGRGLFEDGVAAEWRGDCHEEVADYLRAAAQGDARAQNSLGTIYNRGHCLTEDYVEAVKWYRQAAAQGYELAAYNLGLMYLNGKGVTKDYVRAYMWLYLSSVTGRFRNGNFHGEIAQRMTPSEIAEAQKMAGECRQRDFKNCG